MAKLTRVTGKVFGSTALSTEIGQFGSAVAGSKLETSDISTIQALDAWLTGFSEALVSDNRYPALQELNGLLKVLSYQGCYILQEGISEYDSGTTYYIGSIVKKTGTFELYGSLINSNVGNALVDGANWKKLIDLSASLTVPLPTGYINGLVPQNNATTPNTKIDISAGMCRSDGDTTDIVLSAIITKDLSANFVAGSGNGGLNTGTKAPNTWYDMYIIAKADGAADVMFSTFANRGILPSGFLYKRRVGAVLTDASGNIKNGSWFIKSDGSLDFYWFQSITDKTHNNDCPTSYTDLTVSAYRGSKAKCLFVGGGAQTGYIGFSVKLKTTGTPELILAPTFTYSGAAAQLPISAEIPVDSNSQCQYKFSNATTGSISLYFQTLGYTDERIA